MTLFALIACPDCAPARAARELVLADGLWPNALFAVLPFVILGVAVPGVARLLDRPSRGKP